MWTAGESAVGGFSEVFSRKVHESQFTGVVHPSFATGPGAPPLRKFYVKSNKALLCRDTLYILGRKIIFRYNISENGRAVY
jgi:hypothetical protein